MLVLALDSALARCSAGIVADGVLRAGRQQEAGRGQAALLPMMVQQCWMRLASPRPTSI